MTREAEPRRRGSSSQERSSGRLESLPARSGGDSSGRQRDSGLSGARNSVIPLRSGRRPNCNASAAARVLSEEPAELVGEVLRGALRGAPRPLRGSSALSVSERGASLAVSRRVDPAGSSVASFLRSSEYALVEPAAAGLDSARSSGQETRPRPAPRWFGVSSDSAPRGIPRFSQRVSFHAVRDSDRNESFVHAGWFPVFSTR